MKKRESEKHQSWCLPAELFQGHVVTDGSLPGIAGKWRACGWSVVQLDFVMKNWDLCTWRGVTGVFGVLVSPWLVGDLGAVSLPVSDGEFVVPQSFSFFRKRPAFLMESQGDMSMAGSPEDVLPMSRRRTQKKWIAESTKGGLRSTNPSQE